MARNRHEGSTRHKASPAFLALRLAAPLIVVLAAVRPVSADADCIAGSEEVPTSAACELRIGEPRSGMLRTGETVAYKPPSAYAPLIVTVTTEGADLQLAVLQADGEGVRYDTPPPRHGIERVLVAGRTADVLQITSPEHTGIETRYHIVADRAPRDQAARAAIERETLAARLAAVASAGGSDRSEPWRESYESFRAAAAAYERLDDTAGAARTTAAAAFIRYMHLWEWGGAAGEAAAVTAMWAALGDEARFANATELHAASLLEVAHEGRVDAAAIFDEAKSLLIRSRDTHARLGRMHDAAQVTNNLGLMHYYRGDYTSAEREWQAAALQLRRLDEWSAEATALGNLAVIAYERGELARAVEIQTSLLELLPQGRELRWRADTLDNLGNAQGALNRLDDALDSYTSALAIHDQLGDLKGKAQSLDGIAAVYYGTGEFERAREYFERALQLRRQARDARGEASTLRYLGAIARLAGDLRRAERHLQKALDLVEAPVDRAKYSVTLATIYADSDRHVEALELLREQSEAIAAAGSRAHVAEVDLALARSLHATGEFAAADLRANAALDAFAALADAPGEAASLLVLSRIAQERSDRQRALRLARRSLDKLALLRGRVIDPELRATYFARQREHFEWLIELLMTSGRPADIAVALEVSESTRARFTIDLFAETLADVQRGVSPELLALSRELHDRLSELRYSLDRTSDDTEQVRVAEQLRKTETELLVLQGRMRRDSPRYAALTAPPVLDIDGMRAMLDDDAALVQYFLGERNSYAWVLTADSVSGLLLPQRTALERRARSLHEALKTHPSQRNGADVAGLISELSQALIAPLQPLLGTRRLVVAADGALQYIPFAVLEHDGQPLVQSFEIAYVPSLSALQAQDLALDTRAAPSQTIAVFADAVFDRSDSRLNATRGPLTGETDTPNARIEQLGRLAATAREANGIAGLVDRADRHVAIGFDASRAAVLEGALERFRIVHFATHGLVDARYPSLSALALSQYDATGKTIDGLLTLPQIFNVELNADLVALSACDTALGREILGESLYGLTLAFRYAGAREVLSTLWQVSDRASADLMVEFYTRYLVNDESAAASLRAAQLEIARRGSRRDPYYWAAFVLQ